MNLYRQRDRPADVDHSKIFMLRYLTMTDLPSRGRLDWRQCQQLIDVLRTGLTDTTELEDAARMLGIRLQAISSPLDDLRGRTSRLVEYANSYYQMRELLGYFAEKWPPHTSVYTTCQHLLRFMASNQQQSLVAAREVGKIAHPRRNKVLISYSRTDAKWLERLHVHLKPLERRGMIELWDDTKIMAGTRWKEAMTEALETAAIAIVLVSADFLAAERIAEHELPALLTRAQASGTTIIPVILSPSMFSDTELGAFQPINAPDHPLSGMSRMQQEEVFEKVVKTIRELL
jgi:hypothetical protein